MLFEFLSNWILISLRFVLILFISSLFLKLFSRFINLFSNSIIFILLLLHNSDILLIVFSYPSFLFCATFKFEFKILKSFLIISFSNLLLSIESSSFLLWFANSFILWLFSFSALFTDFIFSIFFEFSTPHISHILLICWFLFSSISLILFLSVSKACIRSLLSLIISCAIIWNTLYSCAMLWLFWSNPWILLKFSCKNLLNEDCRKFSSTSKETCLISRLKCMLAWLFWFGFIWFW